MAHPWLALFLVVGVICGVIAYRNEVKDWYDGSVPVHVQFLGMIAALAAAFALIILLNALSCGSFSCSQ